MRARCQELDAYTKGEAEHLYRTHLLPSLRGKYEVVACKKCDKYHIRKKNEREL